MINIQSWIGMHLAQWTHDKYHEIHIDELNAAYKRRKNTWIHGLQCFLDVGWQYLADSQYKATLAGCISLRSLPTATGVNFFDLSTLHENLDDTPPSIYLFQRHLEPWASDNSDFVKIAVLDMPQDCLYLEYKQDDEVEYKRSLWIIRVQSPSQ
jgi:hypothetical protein